MIVINANMPINADANPVQNVALERCQAQLLLTDGGQEALRLAASPPSPANPRLQLLLLLLLVVAAESLDRVPLPPPAAPRPHY
jgi:hypothetical protein